MKNNMITLTKILLKNGSGTELSTKKKRSTIFLVIILVLSFLPLAINMAYFFSNAYDAMSSIGQEGVIPGLGLAVSSFVIFFFGIFYIINTFYFAEDIENLLPLPLRPYEILGAKFIQVTIYEYLTELIVLLPILGIFAFKSSAGALYYIYAILIFILLPVIPLSLSSIIVMIIMRFTNLAKNKDRFRIVGGVAAMFLAIGVNTYIQKVMSSTLNEQDMTNMLMQGNNSLVKLTSRIFPGTQWGAAAIAESGSLKGFNGLLVFLLITVAFLLIFLYMGNLLYLKGVIGGSQVSSKKVKTTGAGIEKMARQNSVMKSYIAKEIKLLVRTPIYFINCVLMNFLWPAFLIIPLLTQPNFGEQIKNFKSYLSGGNNSQLILAIGFGFILFLASSNGIAYTAISREGHNLFFCKYIPVSYKTQILAKAYSGVVMSAGGMVVSLVVAEVLLALPAYELVLILLTGFLGILFSAFSGIIIDLYNPKLEWDNEQKAVKQNINVLFSMLISVAFAGLVILATFKLKLSFIVLSLLLTSIVGLADVAVYSFISSKGAALFEKLEN